MIILIDLEIKFGTKKAKKAKKRERQSCFLAEKRERRMLKVSHFNLYSNI